MSTTTPPHLAEGEVYDILRNDRRRSVIESLHDSGGTGTVSALADQIAATEAGETPPPRNVRQSVYVSLHQTHLPRLDEAGIVTFDATANEVRLLDRADELAAFLNTPTPDTETPPQMARYYLGVATLGVALVVTSLVGLPLVTGLSPAQWGLLSLAIIAAVAGGELYREFRTAASAQASEH